MKDCIPNGSAKESTMIRSKTCVLILHSLPLLLNGLFNTLIVASVGLSIGIIGGIVCGLLSCNKYKSWYTFPITIYVLVIQGTPVFLQLLLVYFAVPAAIGINFSALTAGIITLGVNSIAYITEIMRGGINAINNGQWEASYVLGLSTSATIKKIILPQVAPIVFLPLVNESTTLLKETSIMATIGLCELTQIGMNISARTLDPITTYTVIGGIYLVITLIITCCTKFLERKVRYD